jgi:hypothetical protein
VCPDLFHPANGTVHIDSSGSGKKATYSCNTNYSVVGDSSVKCSCGQWFNGNGDPASETVCRRDGNWGSWSPYSECTKTCGTGSQFRTRNCTNPPPEPFAKDCPGDARETKPCNDEKCPVCSVQRDIVIGDLNITVEPNGAEVRFSCPNKENFELKGNETQSCVGLDLSSIEVFCVKVCPILPNPKNGNVTILEDQTIAIYKCNIGFSLRGSEVRECDDGVWTGTEAECVSDLIKAGENVKPVGTNLNVGLSAGTFDIHSPDVLISQCKAVATFNFRTTTTRANVDVTARLVLIDNDTVNSTITSTTVKLQSINYSSDEPKPVCIPLVCSDTSLTTSGHSNMSNVVLVGTLIITVSVDDGIAEFSGVNFLEGETCDDRENNTDGSCDTNTESGDCGYRNSGCGTGPFELSLISNSTDNENDGEPVVGLMNDQNSSSACPIFVCLPCLKNSGFFVSLRDKNETSPSTRKKRSFVTVTVGTSKAFCLYPRAGQVLSNDVRTPQLVHHNNNRYLSFKHSLYKNGIHELVVYVECTDNNGIIHVGKQRLTYKITNYRKVGEYGQKCLDVHNYVKKNRCAKFSVVFQGFALSKPLCISDIQFTRKKGTNICKQLDNL